MAARLRGRKTAKTTRSDKRLWRMGSEVKALDGLDTFDQLGTLHAEGPQ